MSLLRLLRGQRNRPWKILSIGLLTTFFIHSVSFWARQGGVFSEANIPLSVFAPAVGWELLLGPILEIVRGSDGPTSTLARLLLGLAIFFLFREMIILKLANSKTTRERKTLIHPNALNMFIHVAVCIGIALITLPEPSFCTIALAVLVVTSVTLRLSRDFSHLFAILILLLTAHNFSHYHAQGKLIVKDRCNLVFNAEFENSNLVACWLYASSKYAILSQRVGQNVQTLAIPVESFKSLKFPRMAPK